MTTVRITGQFTPGETETVGRMCWIAPDLAGEVSSIEVAGHTVYLSFPIRESNEVKSPGYNGRSGHDPRIQWQ